jgi:mannose-6-phosphate isomerase
MLLVKLLDAGQRLPVHAHPDGQFAQTHVACCSRQGGRPGTS